MPQPATVTDRADVSDDPQLVELTEQVLTAARGASAKKATDVAILQVGPLVGITDFYVIWSTANDRQLKAAAEEAERVLRETHGRKPIRTEGGPEAGWIVLDYGDYVIHAFTAAQRAVYNLERLWGDATRIPFDEPAPAEPPAVDE